MSETRRKDFHDVKVKINLSYFTHTTSGFAVFPCTTPGKEKKKTENPFNSKKALKGKPKHNDLMRIQNT